MNKKKNSLRVDKLNKIIKLRFYIALFGAAWLISMAIMGLEVWLSAFLNGGTANITININSMGEAYAEAVLMVIGVMSAIYFHISAAKNSARASR